MSPGFSGLRVTADRRLLSGVASPAPRIGGLRREIQVMPFRQNLVISAGMPLVRANVSDSAVQMLHVVPVYVLTRPVSGFVQIIESASDILRLVLGGSEGRFRKGVVVAYPWPPKNGSSNVNSSILMTPARPNDTFSVLP